VKNYKNRLNSNTRGWCTIAEGCNGQYNSYGTIDIVKPSFSNNGSYGVGASAPGQPRFARLSGAPGNGFPGSPVPNPPTIEGTDGCTPPGSEYCSGPYVLYGLGTDSVFPANGFTSSIEVYIDPAWATSHPGQVFDWDVSLNDTTGNFLVDEVFNFCSEAGGWYVSTSQNAGGCVTDGGTLLTTAGWYTLKHDFSPLNGTVYVTFTTLDPSGATVYNLARPVTTQVGSQPVASTGGPNYGWFPDEDVLGLPVARISLLRN
jgi:hypothetical protein